MDDKNPPNSETEDPAASETPLPNIEAFTNAPKEESRKNLYVHIGVGVVVVLALAVSLIILK